MLIQGHGLQTSTQSLGKQWPVFVLGLLPQQSSLEHLKYVPDANAAYSAGYTDCAQNITSNNLCVMIVSKITLTGKCHVCAFLQVTDKKRMA